MSDHESVFTGFAADVQSIAGPALRSVTVYGSSVMEHFRPGVSDYNFLIVADPVGTELLARLGEQMRAWRKKRIAVPLVLDPAFLKESLDTYPLEFLSMKAHYRVLAGEDVLQGLSFDPKDVRLQCERELRSKLLLFRRAYVDAAAAPNRFRILGRGVPAHLIARSVPSFAAVFRGMLFLKDGPWHESGRKFWEACVSHSGRPGGDGGRAPLRPKSPGTDGS